MQGFFNAPRHSIDPHPQPCPLPSLLGAVPQVPESGPGPAARRGAGECQHLGHHDEFDGQLLRLPSCTAAQGGSRQEAGAEVLPGEAQRGDGLYDPEPPAGSN